VAYTNNKKVVTMVEPLLRIMLQAADGKTIIIPSKEPTRVSYKLREALKLVEKHTKLYTEFASLVGKYTIKIKADGIELKPKFTLDFEDPITELAKAFKVLDVPEAEDAMEVIGAIIKHKAPKFIFPSYMHDDMPLLQGWLVDSDYVIECEIPLTIVKRAETNSTQDGGPSV
jgi:hypothetical protein